ncbi:lactate utilization protein [Anaerocolumna sp. AGMB13020]|uniref:lactate utilization protein n=1 Tax=Anaerocolumna sp. AGMB13020 TaxID=3081750 RepID=UPI0029557DC4|nr:lactate utilization protein [Anaerocolumna sp. AGMB13020]WOO37080.1 lactate utilization protein [Anaerocolumna sp. AGMB13020]
MEFTKLINNLESLGYTVSEFNDAEEATKYLANQLSDRTIGIGGSVTVEEMNLYDALVSRNDVYWHMRLPENMSVMEARKRANLSDLYISSVNGIAETGEIINIDNTGNRVSAISFGHDKVYFIVGENKIASSYEEALDRARNIAAPLNAKRLGVKTPCAIKGDKCYDCKSPQRICRNFSVLWEKPTGSEYEVILIHEKLGY